MRCAGGRNARHKDIFALFKIGPDLSEILPHPSSQAVARNGVAHLGGCGKAHSQSLGICIHQHHIPRGKALALAVYVLIIPVLAEAKLLSAQTERMRGCHFYFRNQTVRRLRPRRRRALRTARPALVFMRARKP